MPYEFNAHNSIPHFLHYSDTLTMAKPASFSFSFFFLSLIIICCSGILVDLSFGKSLIIIPGGAMSFLKQSKMSLTQIGILRRTLGDTTFITVPSTNPVSVSPINPAAMPITVPSTNVPVAYPPPSSPPTVPVINSQPPPSTPAPTTTTTGQRWCMAKTGASQSALQSALDYACGMGGADCSQIQQGGRCYNPNTLENHASYAFNAYYQKNPIPSSCDFGGTATLVNTNPSSGSCIYPSSSSSSSTPTPSSPTPSTPSAPTPTPMPTTTPSSPGVFGYGSPSSALNSTSSNSGSGYTPVLGSPSPPSVSTTSWSHSAALRPSVGCTILLISLVTGKLNIAPRVLV